MEEQNKIQEIESRIEELKMKKKNLKQIREKKLRLRSNNCGKSNIPIRVSINFQNKIDTINDKREENGFDRLSGPKITELIITHKKCFPIIENDIIHYNTILNIPQEDIEFNDK